MTACATTGNSTQNQSLREIEGTVYDSSFDASKVEWTKDGLPTPQEDFSANISEDTIRPLDTLTISVFEVPRLSGDYPVNINGDIKMPILGEVNAKKLTAYEFSTKLENLLGENYLQNPQVTVQKEASEAEKVTVDGSVKRPGIFPIRGKTTLLQAIALSGGADENANLGRVAIFRTIEGTRKAANFNVRKIRLGEAPDPELFGNDIVVVDGSELKEGYRLLLRSLPLAFFFR